MSNLKLSVMKTRTYLLIGLLALQGVNALSQNLLRDGSFESSLANGTWPSSGAWRKSWYPFDAGAVVSYYASYDSRCGLWIYTSSGNSFSRPYQELLCEPLNVYKAEAYLRCPRWEEWTSGTRAFISLSFIGKTGFVVKEVKSEVMMLPVHDWHLHSVSCRVPEGAVKVRYMLHLESKCGQSILNADACRLTVQKL